MSAIDDPKTLSCARLSFADQHDIDEFIATLEKSERGEIGPDQWRTFRLVRGAYGQRQDDDVHMLRCEGAARGARRAAALRLCDGGRPCPVRTVETAAEAHRAVGLMRGAHRGPVRPSPIAEGRRHLEHGKHLDSC